VGAEARLARLALQPSQADFGPEFGGGLSVASPVVTSVAASAGPGSISSDGVDAVVVGAVGRLDVVRLVSAPAQRGDVAAIPFAGGGDTWRG